MSSLLTDTQQGEVKYVVKVRGQVRTAPLTRALAESQVNSLPLEEQPLAEIVPVTTNGQEILLG